MGLSFGFLDPFNLIGIDDDRSIKDKFLDPVNTGVDYLEITDATQDAKDEQQAQTDAIMNQDIGKWLTDYVNAISDPEFNEKLLGAEEAYRGRWTELGLEDQYDTLFGTDDQMGTLGMLAQMMPQVSQMQADALSAQRESDVTDIENLGGRAIQAMRDADPQMQALIGKQTALTNKLYDQSGQVNAQQQRSAEQQARAAYGARGRAGDMAGIFGEAMGRENVLRQNRFDAQQSGNQLFGMLKSTGADPFQSILGRPSGAYAGAQFQQNFGQGQAFNAMGPQIYDPNAGVNLGLGQQANMLNYNAALAGSDAASSAGQMQALGSMGAAAMMMFCWVAREVYGTEDDRWTLFRTWLLMLAPTWFANLYRTHGPAFASWISNKPLLKWAVRKWMDGRIKTLENRMGELSYGI